MGDPMDESTYIGAITREPQLQVLASQVADARQRGATLLMGGAPVLAETGGSYYPPTVVDDLQPCRRERVSQFCADRVRYGGHFSKVNS